MKILSMLLVTAVALSSQAAFSQAADAPVTEAQIRAHIEQLASDAFGGRRPGTPGETLTAHYIATQLAAAGWQAGTAGEGGWYAPVPLIELAPDRSNIIVTSSSGATVDIGTEFALRAPAGTAILRDAEAVFVGHGPGADGQVHGDVAGRVALMLATERAGAPPSSTLRRRRDALIAAGARAVLVISDVDAPFAAFLRGYSSGQIQLGQALGRLELDGLLSEETGARLLDAGGLSPIAAGELAGTEAAFARRLDARLTLEATSRSRRYDSYNVVARLPGRRANGEVIMLTGHWDHLGECRPATASDRICNGAVDNASGIAVLLELARRLGAGPRLDRDIWIVATTAEESGLLGAYHFAANPPIPAENIRVVLNVDTVAIAPRAAPVAWIGRGNPVIDAAVTAAAASVGRTLDTDTEADAFVRRQDGWAFQQSGIPAIMAGGSFSDMPLLQRFLSGNYHGPDDELTSDTPLGGAAEDADLHVALVRYLGNRRTAPSIPR